jgi:hypothetical protein
MTSQDFTARETAAARADFLVETVAGLRRNAHSLVKFRRSRRAAFALAGHRPVRLFGQRDDSTPLEIARQFADDGPGLYFASAIPTLRGAALGWLWGSQRVRKRIEEAFGWIKTVAGQDRTKFRGRERVGWAFTFGAAAYNLARLPKLMEASA